MTRKGISELAYLSPKCIIFSSPPSRVFALIIGINEYEHPAIKNLLGAVPDADAMDAFLQTIMHAPSNRIQNLRNEKATRYNIRSSLENLATNRDINEGDPILVFYAGHGGEASAPVGWPSGKGRDGKIQMICPYDFVPLRDAPGEGQGIFDLSLAVLLDRIAKTKGDNIVSNEVYAFEWTMT